MLEPDFTNVILDSHPDAAPWPAEDRMFGRRRAIGYWCSRERPDLRDPRELIDKTGDTRIPELFKKVLVRYLSQGRELASWRGWSNCRVCGVRNGSRCLGDDTFVWPEGLVHYIERHEVLLPMEFLEHVSREAAARATGHSHPKPKHPPAARGSSSRR